MGGRVGPIDVAPLRALTGHHVLLEVVVDLIQIVSSRQLIGQVDVASGARGRSTRSNMAILACLLPVAVDFRGEPLQMLMVLYVVAGLLDAAPIELLLIDLAVRVHL